MNNRIILRGLNNSKLLQEKNLKVKRSPNNKYLKIKMNRKMEEVLLLLKKRKEFQSLNSLGDL